MPPPGTTTAPPVGTPTTGVSGTAGTSPDPATIDTGTPPILTPIVTPTVTPTEYFEHDSTELVGAPTPSVSATSLATTVPTSVPSAAAETATSTQAPTRTERTPRSADTTEKVTSPASRPSSVTIYLRVQGGEFSPTSVTVPAGAQVTIVFDNRDADVKHNAIVFAEGNGDDPIFTGTVVRGTGQATDTFTAPSIPGTYALGCGVPAPHKKGTFTVE